ncbi:MAG: tRNA (guanosine(46)-N7)-methyltransferase TrmB [Bacteroidales bacterium]|jgi:tRNA (guanine-N7-)-methyltransferase|nr:tRNA (guanosine(46)-N7)-methyltransferase TrmB [Bacteroidales bacterium]
MSGKDKLRRFRENATFKCLLQPSFEEVYEKDFRFKGKWRKEIFGNDNPIILELGCGKGEYTVSMAQAFPDKNFIGMDIKGARLWKGAKYVEEHSIGNAIFIRSRIEFITAFFAKGEIDEIWITFADPQLGKARKRLTGSMFLNRYTEILKKNGIINLKTDSKYLYNYTLAAATQNGLGIIEAEDDIYGNEKGSGILGIKTFYETNFLKIGLPIQYLSFHLETEKRYGEPEWDEDFWLKEEEKGRKAK